jgi:hypothetical protein
MTMMNSPFLESLCCLVNENEVVLYTMGDDLANEWGTTLVHLDDHRRRSAVARVHSIFDKQALFRYIAADLAHIPGGVDFEPIKICGSGSEANAFAISALTSSVEALLIGSGSFVCGDAGHLQGYSTCDFRVDFGPAGIVTPQFAMNKIAGSQTVPLPYHIPGTMDNEELYVYEDKCI